MLAVPFTLGSKLVHLVLLVPSAGYGTGFGAGGYGMLDGDGGGRGGGLLDGGGFGNGGYLHAGHGFGDGCGGDPHKGSGNGHGTGTAGADMGDGASLAHHSRE